MIRFLTCVAAVLAFAGTTHAQSAEPSAIDREVRRVLADTGARGLALAVIEDGEIAYVNAWGERNAAGEALQTDTVMYGASLTKAVFAYTVMQLVDEGVIDLDRPIADYLDRPLPDYYDPDTVQRYADWRGLGEDDRWRQLTPRILLTHSSGFLNFGFLSPDGRVRIYFEPGSRYSYSGDGLILLQFVVERGLGLDVGAEMQRRVFDRFGMVDTSMTWRPDFGDNLADGWDAEGRVEPHDERSRVRAAGSMDTTIADFARFAAAFMRGEGLSASARAEMVRGQVPIGGATQFPTMQPDLPPEERRPDLAAGLGVVVFSGPQGPGFIKGGHNDTTANTWVCIEEGRRCLVILANDVRAERGFARLSRIILGQTAAPWLWEYGPDYSLP